MASAGTSPELTPAFLAEDRRPAAIVGMSVVTALSAVIVLLRIYVRWRLIKSFGWDGGPTIAAAMLLNFAVMALSFQVLRYGAGRHIYALEPAGMVKLFKWLVAAQLVYMLCLWLCRLSGLAFYARLNQMPRFKLYLRISFAFVTAVFIAQVLIIALQCIPLAALWGEAKGKCLGSKAVFISTATMTIICDSLILLLPCNIIYTLKASLSRKIALAVVLCFGVFAVVTSICRIVSMIPAVTEPDATWYFSVVMTWSDVEVSTAIIALSLPAMKGLFGLVARRRKESTNNPSGSQESHRMKYLRSKTSQQLYDGDSTEPNDVCVGTRENTSEEALCPDANAGGITVKNTVQMKVDRV